MGSRIQSPRASPPLPALIERAAQLTLTRINLHEDDLPSPADSSHRSQLGFGTPRSERSDVRRRNPPESPRSARTDFSGIADKDSPRSVEDASQQRHTQCSVFTPEDHGVLPQLQIPASFDDFMRCPLHGPDASFSSKDFQRLSEVTFMQETIDEAVNSLIYETDESKMIHILASLQDKSWIVEIINDQCNLFHLAVIHNNSALVKALLRLGVDVCKETKSGRIALEFVFFRPLQISPDIIIELLKRTPNSYYNEGSLKILQDAYPQNEELQSLITKIISAKKIEPSKLGFLSSPEFENAIDSARHAQNEIARLKRRFKSATDKLRTTQQYDSWGEVLSQFYKALKIANRGLYQVTSFATILSKKQPMGSFKRMDDAKSDD